MSAEPSAAQAHAAVARAIARGALTRPTRCEACGAESDGSRVIEAHHPNYSEPLSVMWLCFDCHRAEHRCLRRAAARGASRV